MNSFAIGLLVGFGAVLVTAAIVKWRRRDMPMSVAEKAEYLSKRRARMLPALAIIFLSQQATFFSTVNSPASHSAYTVKISAWLVLSIVLLLALSTKGFWLEGKEVRDLIDDENTRANRNDAMRWGFLFSMAAAIAVYALTLFDVTVTARDAVHIVMTMGIAIALIRWGMLEKRAHRYG
jgi:uncharacterized membrane protein HdeD (DUF308 family)